MLIKNYGHNFFFRSAFFRSGCPFVPLQVKVFGQGNFWWSWSPINSKLVTHGLWYDHSNFNAKFKFWSQFQSPLNIENDSAFTGTMDTFLFFCFFVFSFYLSERYTGNFVQRQMLVFCSLKVQQIATVVGAREIWEGVELLIC